MLRLPKVDAYLIYLLLSGGSSLAFALAYTVHLVYQVSVVGLDPLQLVLVGTALEVTILIFEVPTGVVADTFSRRLSVVIGFGLLGLGIIIAGTIPLFEAILFSSFVSGVGYTFLSGATEAWIVDEIGVDRAGAAFLRGAQAGQVMGIIGIVLSVTLASIRLNLAIIAGGVTLLLLCMILLLFMPENGFQRKAREDREPMFRTLFAGLGLLRGRPLLLTLLAVGILHGAFSEGFDRLWTAHVLQNFTLPALGSLQPVIWFGIIDIVSMLFSMVITEAVRRRVDMTNAAQVARGLMILYGLLVGALLIFALTSEFYLALGALWLAAACRGNTGPLFSTWLNQNIDSGVRATVISIYGQADAVGQIAGGPGVGWLGRTFSLRAALTLSALILLPVLPLVGRGRAQSQRDTVSAEASTA